MNVMQWWVPLGAAAIALFGVIVGQLMSALVEGHRHRKEIRRRDFEHWRDKKFEAYSEFLRLSNAWQTEIVLYAYLVEREFSRRDRESRDDANDPVAEVIRSRFEASAARLREIMDALGRYAGVIGLVGSNGWTDLSHEIHMICMQTHTMVLNKYTAALEESGARPYPHDELRTFVEESLPSRWVTLQREARAELGIEF